MNDAPLLSVTVKLNPYISALRFDINGNSILGSLIVAVPP